jgi:spermidine/putrescine transport system permease protein
MATLFDVSGKAVGPPGKRSDWVAWLLLSPLLIWLVLFVVIPTALLVVYSFAKSNVYNQPAWEFTWENYRRIFEPGTPYLSIIWQSLVYAGLTALLCLLIGYPVAYFIGRSSERWRNLLMLLVMIPFWTSFLIRTYAWFQILAGNGLINTVLMDLGIIEERLRLLYTDFAVVLGLVYNYLPFMILPIYSSVEKLDGSLIEAAYDLGANPFRAFWRVILPLTWAGVVAGTLLVFVPALAMYAITSLMGGERTILIGNVIQDQFIGGGRNAAFGAALGSLLLALFVVAIWVSMGRRREQHPG